MSAFWAEREDLGRKAFPPPIPHKLESLRGPGHSNVIFKGFALGGSHPGSTTSEIVANLTPLLRAGVTTFVCLQNELPRAGHAVAHQRSAYAHANVVTAKNYLPDAQAMLDAGGFPQSGGPPLSLLHLPISDAAGATVPDDILKSFVLKLMAHMKAGEYLYIQCGDGNGRTGTLTAILLGLAYNLSSSEALDLAQRSRADRPGAFGTGPETHEQKMQVHRLLGDKAFRDAAARIDAMHSDSHSADASSRLDSTLKKIRTVLCKKGPMSLIYLRRYAHSLASLPISHMADATNNATLDYTAFCKLTQDAEWYLTPEETECLWGAVASAEPSGPRSVRSGSEAGGFATANITNLFKTIRGNMSARRAAVVHEVFKRLSFNSGFSTLEVLAAAFHPETHPDVRAGRRSSTAVKDEFYDTFGIGSRDESARRQVSAAEFEEYYSDISAATPDDAYFEILVFGSWPTEDVAARKPVGKTTMVSKAAAASSVHLVAPKQVYPSVLQEAYVRSGEAGKLAGHTTEHGYTYIDVAEPAIAVKALRSYLSSKSDFMIGLLAATLRRNDPRRDGQVDVYEFKQALKDADAALPDVDAETAFLGLASCVYRVRPRELEMTKTLLPIEETHELLRDRLTDAKRSVVLNLFNSFDKEGTGAIPIATLLLAFKAEAYPPVATGKMSPHVVYKQFQDAFADGFSLIDKFGPESRAAGLGSLPARAYYGSGDGLVRFPFFEAFHEAMAVSLKDDAAFSHVVAHIWSGGSARRAPKASVNPQTVARRADGLEDGFMSNLERLSMNHPYQPSAMSNSGGTATRSFAHKGDTAIGTSVARPPAHAGALSPPPRDRGAPATPVAPDTERDRRTRTMQSSDAGSQYTSPSIFSGGDGFTGKTQSALRGSPRYTVGSGHAPLMYAPVPDFNDADVDNVLHVVREVLFRRGVKSIYSLARMLEDAAAGLAPSRVGDIFAPMPVSTFVAVVRDASFGLSPRQTDTLVAAVEAQSRCGPRAVVPHTFLTMVRGRLNSAREDIVRKAYSQVCRKSSGVPSVDDVRMMYKSAAHPDAVSRKRDEETVLREFLETFDGPAYVEPSGHVRYEGFAEYFANLSFYYAEDMHFAVLMFDTWALGKDDASGDSVAAGRPTTLDGASYVAPSGGSPASTYSRWQRGGTLVLGDEAPQDFRPAHRGHGLERLGYGYQSR